MTVAFACPCLAPQHTCQTQPNTPTLWTTTTSTTTTTTDLPYTLYALGVSNGRPGTAERTTTPAARLAWPKDVLTPGKHLSLTPPSSPAANYTPDAPTTLADASYHSQSPISSSTSPLTRLAVPRLPRRVLFSFPSTLTSAGFPLAYHPVLKTVCAMQGPATTFLLV